MADGLPPPRFDHPYQGQYIEYVVPWKQMQAICSASKNFEEGQIVYACSITQTGEDKNKCVVFLPLAEDTDVPQDYLRRHEIGHCNGWPADHGP